MEWIILALMGIWVIDLSLRLRSSRELLQHLRNKEAETINNPIWRSKLLATMLYVEHKEDLYKWRLSEGRTLGARTNLTDAQLSALTKINAKHVRRRKLFHLDDVDTLPFVDMPTDLRERYERAHEDMS